MEEAFVLMYFGKGITFLDVLEMTNREREWLVKRLLKQIKLEKQDG